MKLSPLFVALLLSAILFAACGVRFSDPPQGNEFFRGLTVTGDKRAGMPLTASVSFRQYYPVEVPVQCELKQGKKVVKPIGQDTVQSYPDGSPKVTPFPGNFSFDFAVDAPGTYKVKCYTVKDTDNSIVEEFSVGPAARQSPTPPPLAPPRGA